MYNKPRFSSTGCVRVVYNSRNQIHDQYDQTVHTVPLAPPAVLKPHASSPKKPPRVDPGCNVQPLAGQPSLLFTGKSGACCLAHACIYKYTATIARPTTVARHLAAPCIIVVCRVSSMGSPARLVATLVLSYMSGVEKSYDVHINRCRDSSSQTGSKCYTHMVILTVSVCRQLRLVTESGSRWPPCLDKAVQT